jgi:hypothetical protein
MPADPAKHSVGEGRYSHAGQSVMYMADDKDGAAIECVGDAENRAWVQAFRIQQVDKILDLSDEEAWANEDMPSLACGLMHAGAVRQFSDRTNSWKPEYFCSAFHRRLRSREGIQWDPLQKRSALSVQPCTVHLRCSECHRRRNTGNHPNRGLEAVSRCTQIGSSSLSVQG